jgi:predicted  nucleic acid-binding Zn-ribbon protein
MNNSMSKKIVAGMALLLALSSGIAVDDWLTRRELAATQEELAAAEAQVVRLEKDAKELRKALGNAANDLAEKHKEADGLREKLGITEQQLVAAQGEVSKLKAKLKESEQNGADLQARYDALGEQLAGAEKAAAVARAETAKAQTALNDALAAGASNIAELEDKLIEAQKVEDELKAEVTSKVATVVALSEVLAELPMEELAAKRAASLAKEIELATCGKPFGRQDNYEACVDQIAKNMAPVADALRECWMKDRDAHDGIATFASDARGAHEIVATTKGKVFVELCSDIVTGTQVARGAVGLWKASTTHDWIPRSPVGGEIDLREAPGKLPSVVRGVR